MHIPDADLAGLLYEEKPLRAVRYDSHWRSEGGDLLQVEGMDERRKRQQEGGKQKLLHPHILKTILTEPPGH